MNRIWWVLSTLSLLTITALVGCTSATSTTSPPTTTPPPTTTTAPKSVTVDLVAQNVKFNLSTITVPAGAAVTINFNNKDSGVIHNFSLYANSSAAPPALFQGQNITGPATTVYTFTAPTTPGTYFFRCDIHPTIMTGTFVVTAQ